MILESEMSNTDAQKKSKAETLREYAALYQQHLRAEIARCTAEKQPSNVEGQPLAR